MIRIVDVVPGESFTSACDVCEGAFGTEVRFVKALGKYDAFEWVRFKRWWKIHELCGVDPAAESEAEREWAYRVRTIQAIYAENPGIKFEDLKLEYARIKAEIEDMKKVYNAEKTK